MKHFTKQTPRRLLTVAGCAVLIHTGAASGEQFYWTGVLYGSDTVDIQSGASVDIISDTNFDNWGSVNLSSGTDSRLNEERWYIVDGDNNPVRGPDNLATWYDWTDAEKSDSLFDGSVAPSACDAGAASYGESYSCVSNKNESFSFTAYENVNYGSDWPARVSVSNVSGSIEDNNAQGLVEIISNDDVVINSDSNAGGAGDVEIRVANDTVLSVYGGTDSTIEGDGVTVSGDLTVEGSFMPETVDVGKQIVNTDTGEAVYVNDNLNVSGATEIRSKFTVDYGNDGGNELVVGNGTTTIQGGGINTMKTTSGGTIRTTTTGVSAFSNNSRSGLYINDDGYVSLYSEQGTTDAALTISADGQSVNLLNDVNGGHGLEVTGTTTSLTGGTNTSSLTLQDEQATLAVGTATSDETDAIVVTGKDSDGVGTGELTTTTVTIGGVNNTENNLLATATDGVNNIVANSTTGTNNIEAATNNIGVSDTYATSNNIGTGADFSSTNIIGNTNNGTVVNSYGGLGYTTVNNTNSTLGTGTGGMVQTAATSVTLRASSSGSLASNGVTGVMTIGRGGGYQTYQTAQTVASDTTINNILAGAQYTNRANGDLLIDGNAYINGRLNAVSSDAANITVAGNASKGTGESILLNPTQRTAGNTTIVLKGTDSVHASVDRNGRITMASGVADESSASLTLTNGYGESRGLIVTERQTTISGGARSSSMTLNGNGATFSHSATGMPVQVHGVADGTADFDAVNVRQLAYATASVAAMSNIPDISPGKTSSFGIGLGSHMGKSAIALGASVRPTDNLSVKLSVSHGIGEGSGTTFGTGATWSW